MGAIQKVGNFLGIKKFADAMATTGRVLSGEVNQDIQNQTQNSIALQKLTYVMKNEKDPNKKKQLQQLLQSQLNAGSRPASEIDPGLNLTNQEILGSAANVGLNVLMPNTFKGSNAAIIGKNAALGGAFGLASGLEKNRNASGVVGSTVGGAVIGAGIGLAGIGLRAAKDFISQKVPEWMMNKAVKPALQDLKKSVKYGGDTLGKELLDEGVKGGPKKLLEIADQNLNQLEDDLQSVLTHKGLDGATIAKEQILPYVDDLIRQKSGTPGMKGDVQRIKNILDDIPEQMTLTEANEMKRRIYQELRDVSYKLDAKLSVKAAGLKQIAKGLKTEIENTVGGTVVRDINHKLSIYGRLENSMVDQLAREMRNNGISLTDAVLLAGGDTTSILALLRHIGKGAETYAAQGLSQIQKIGTGVVGKTAKEVIKRAAFNLP